MSTRSTAVARPGPARRRTGPAPPRAVPLLPYSLPGPSLSLSSSLSLRRRPGLAAARHRGHGPPLPTVTPVLVARLWRTTGRRHGRPCVARRTRCSTRLPTAPVGCFSPRGRRRRRLRPPGSSAPRPAAPSPPALTLGLVVGSSERQISEGMAGRKVAGRRGGRYSGEEGSL